MQVIVLGAGVIGLSIANLLAKLDDLQVVLIADQEPKLTLDLQSYDLRCSAITNHSQKVLVAIQAWDELVKSRHGVFKEMQVWYADNLDRINFDAANILDNQLGYIFENSLLQKVLLNKLRTQSNVKIVFSAAKQMEHLNTMTRVYTTDSSFDANLIVGADGANSWLRKVCNIPCYTWDYQQAALVANIRCELMHNNVARQIFTPNGPLAFLPLDQPNLCSIVWTSVPKQIEAYLQLSRQDFVTTLANEFQYCLGNLELLSAPLSFPLRALHAKTYISKRSVLIGDSAHVVHPLAGQGLNLGLQDAMVLFEVLKDALKSGKELGSQQVLRAYERRQRVANFAMLAVTHGFKHSYKFAKHLDLSLLNKFSYAKNIIMRYASGVSCDTANSAI